MCEFDPRCSGSDDLIGHALSLIARGSWAVTGVYGDESSAPVAYTSGLTELGRPELVVTGIEPEFAGPLLNEAAARVVLMQGFGGGSMITDLRSTNGYALAAVDVIDASSMRVTSLLFGQSFHAVQLVWPDRDGRLPWDRGYALVPDEQPLFGVVTPAAGAR